MIFHKKNPYCTPGHNTFPRWDMMDVSIWKLTPSDAKTYSGKEYLLLYKDSYVKYHRNAIIQSAENVGIPPSLLAGVAWEEAGGTPDRLKSNGVLLWRQFLDFFKDNNDHSNKTSIGIIAMQIRVVAEILGIDPRSLSTKQQLQISRCLESDDFNIKIVAMHLRDLIKYDYPNSNTRTLSVEQIILAGSRYNRGIQRKKSDFIVAIKSSNRNEKDYISYGLALIKRQNRIEGLLKR